MELETEKFNKSKETLSINDDYLEILNYILEEKKAKGFTGKIIAKHLDVSPATISNFENNVNFDYELLFRYAGFLGINIRLNYHKLTFQDRIYL